MSSKLCNDGIKEILNLLDEDEITQLAVTTAQNLIKRENIKHKTEAIDIILQQSPDLSTILNRKVIRREYLFQYLHNKRIKIPPPATKFALINKILKLWNEEDSKTTVQNYESNNEINKTDSSSANDVNLLAIKFTEWFYSIFNNNEPLGEEHFWQDCSLRLNLISDAANSTNTVDNDRVEVVNVLFNTKCEHDLYFNPNLTSEGVKGKMDNHGLVLVFVCGTLHTKDNCVGIFEQFFALARDPFSDNNWKIKKTLLTLRSKSTISSMPTLDNASLNNMMTVYNS